VKGLLEEIGRVKVFTRMK